MKIKLPGSVTRGFSRAVLKTQKNAPQLLLAGGITGMVGSTVLACRATLKAEAVLDRAQEGFDTINAADRSPAEYSDKDRRQDRVYVYTRTVVDFTKLYGPSVALGAVSVYMLTKGHRIQQTRYNNLATAYGVLMTTFADYRDRVRADQGEEKDREYLFGKHTENVLVDDKNGPKRKKVDVPGDEAPYRKLFNEFNPNWSPIYDYNVVWLRGIQNQLNDKLRARGHLFLNEALSDLGMDHTPAGAVTGWLFNAEEGDGYVDLGIFDNPSDTVFREFCVDGEGAVWLDFNVDGEIWRKI